GRIRDQRARVHDEAEDARRVVGAWISVLGGFFARHERTVRQLDAPDPLDVRVAFPSGQQQARGIALFGTDRLSVLRVRDHRVVERLLDRDAARQEGGIVAFGEEPRRLRTRADLTEEGRKHHTGPLALAGHAGELLRRGLRGRGAVEIAGAFEETDARYGERPYAICERE